MTSLIDLNDPKENQTFGFWNIFSGIEDDFRSLEIRNEFECYINNSWRVACFSEDYLVTNTNHIKLGYDHPNMWAHYADKYKGICLVFDKSELFREANIDNINFFYDEIKYCELIEYPQFNPELFKEKSNIYFTRYLTENLGPFFFQKYLNWDNEHEKRIVHFGDKSMISVKNSFRGIIVGTYFDIALIPLLRIVSNHDLWIEQIKIVDGRLFPIPFEFQ